MEGEPGLARLKCVGQLADALFSVLETGDDAQSGFIGERMKHRDEAAYIFGRIFGCGMWHDHYIYQLFLMSQEPEEPVFFLIPT